MDGRIGVLLLNLGGPDSPEAIRPFLSNLFADREIIRLPGGAWGQRLLGRLIVRARLRSARRNYAAIGGHSPLLALTLRQAAALERVFRDEFGLDATVAPAMRYWHPFAGEALGDMAARGIRRIVAMTLYPHYSIATTGSSAHELRRVIERDFRGQFDLTIIDRWPALPGYLDALVGRVRAALGAVPDERREGVALLFSAHGLPLNFIARGDPYVDDIKATLHGVLERLDGQRPWRLAYQSRVGPVRWLRPTTKEALRELARAGCRDVLVVPISFVTDHVETLYEIDQELAHLARELGFVTFRRTAALNDDPGFIRALAGLIVERLGAPSGQSRPRPHDQASP